MDSYVSTVSPHDAMWTKCLLLLDLFSLSLPPSPCSPGLPYVPPRHRPGASQREADQQEDGQQVGQCPGDHQRDAERGAGVLHAGRPVEGSALSRVRLPCGGNDSQPDVPLV